MSRKLLKLTIYTQTDFRHAPKLDRILMSEMEPQKFVLHDYESQYLHDLREAYALIGEELSEGVAIKRIRSEIVGYESYAAASKLLHDVQAYWHCFLSKNREYKQAIVVNKMYALAQKAEEKAENIEDFDAVSKMYERAAKMEGLDKVEHLAINPADIQIGDVIITSDIAALKAEEEDDNNEDDEEDD
jgi:hypothetical protein